VNIGQIDAGREELVGGTHPYFFFLTCDLVSLWLVPCTTLQGLGNVLIFLKSSKHTTRPPQYFSPYVVSAVSMYPS